MNDSEKTVDEATVTAQFVAARKKVVTAQRDHDKARKEFDDSTNALNVAKNELAAADALLSKLHAT